jgi:adenosylcobinamide-GDP ribazoletransferase
LKFITAWRFLTVIPLPFRHDNSPDVVGTSQVYFPVIGLIIGMILAGLNWSLNFVFPHLVINILLIVTSIIITGALHLDGLADTSDGMDGKTIEERWQIMRDSHTGSFGIVGIVCSILLKLILLAVIPQIWFWRTLLVFPVLGRWAIVYAINLFPYARPSGIGKIFKEKARWSILLIASVIVFLISGLLFRWTGLIISAGVIVIITGVALFFKKRFAGLTGDNYGAINEIAEISALLLIVLFTNNNWLFMN